MAAESPRPVSDEWYGRGTFQASLAGRETPWKALLKARRSVVRGAGRVVLIQGEAGVGKTRLAEEFLRWATAEGDTVLKGHGFAPQSGVPYGPIVEILREALEAPGVSGTDSEWLAEAARLAPEIHRRFPAVESPSGAAAADRWRLFEGVAQMILATAGERPVALFIDDLHWCDGESCAMLHFLSRRLAAAPVLFIGTLTLGELDRDAHAARLCRALRTQDRSTAIVLEPLGEEQVWQMIREMGRIQAPTAARRMAARVHEVTGGNPFYVVELLKTLFAQGILAVDPASGEWIAPPGSAMGEANGFPTSRTVHDAIADRIERLPYELRDLLVTVSVAGTGCRADLLSLVHGISRLHAAALCDALVERRIVEEANGAYRPAHPVIGEVVRDGLTASRRHEEHRAIALALDALGSSAAVPEAAGEIARHAELGGEPVMAYRYALAASESASQRLAFEEALSWLDLAAHVAGSGSEADVVNRRTADLLTEAGWSEPPRSASMPVRRRTSLERDDLDLSGVPES